MANPTTDRVAAKKYYVGREIGQLKARVKTLETHLEYARGQVVERNRDLRRIQRSRDELLRLVKKYASERADCDGTGMALAEEPSQDGHRVSCEQCAEIRAVIAKAENLL